CQPYGDCLDATHTPRCCNIGPQLVLAVAELLALRLAAGRGLQYQAEEALARFGDRLRAVDDRAAVEVHVVFLVHEERRVGRELERGRGLAAVRRAAAGGEADHVGAARHLAGRRDRVVARRIHVYEAVGNYRLGVLVDGDQIGGAALRDRAERLLQYGGEAARLVARRGVVVHLVAVAPRVFLPPADARDQFLAHRAAHRAPREQMLGAVDLRRLGKDRGAAMTHQQIDRRAERRVRADA